MLQIILATCLALFALYTLRKKTGTRWQRVLTGWAVIVVAITLTGSELGAERGIPMAITAFSVLAIFIVVLGYTYRAPVFPRNTGAHNIAEAGAGSIWQSALRWFSAGPLALLCSVMSVAVVASMPAGLPGDRVILAIIATIVVWAGLAAWIFFTSRPVRATSFLCALIALCGATIFWSMLR